MAACLSITGAQVQLACTRSRSQEDAEEGYQEAEAALEIMEEAEAEEAELEEVEDLLEYYLQRATTTQSEAERLLAGSRDLEESIGVSLSARRFEVFSLHPGIMLLHVLTGSMMTLL